MKGNNPIDRLGFDEEVWDIVGHLANLPPLLKVPGKTIEPEQHAPRERVMGRRRTAAQVEQLERQIYEVLELDRPQSVRHVFYRLTDPRLPEPVEKSESGYRQVQQRLDRHEAGWPYPLRLDHRRDPRGLSR